MVPPAAVHVTSVLKGPVPVTLAEHVDVCAVVMEEGAGATVTPETVGWMPTVAMEILAVPDFVVS